jgi:hypothetical protein
MNEEYITGLKCQNPEDISSCITHDSCNWKEFKIEENEMIVGIYGESFVENESNRFY